MKIRSWILLILFVAIFFAGFLLLDTVSVTDSISSLYPAPASPTLSEFDDLTLSYFDPVGGYSFRYPIGYPLDVQEGQSAIFYAPGPSGFSESFVFKTSEKSLDPAYMESLVRDEIEHATKISQSRVLVNNEPVWRLEYVLEAQGLEKLHLVQAAVSCKNQWLYFVATIPDSLSQDVELADYVLQSVSC